MLYTRGQEGVFDESFTVDRRLADGAQLVGPITESSHCYIDFAEERFNLYNRFVFNCHEVTLLKAQFRTLSEFAMLFVKINGCCAFAHDA